MAHKSQITRFSGPVQILRKARDWRDHVWGRREWEEFYYYLNNGDLVGAQTTFNTCNRLDEDGGHLFLKCKLTKNVWRELKLQRECDKLSDLANAREVVDQILHEKEEKQNLMFITLWSLWSERNSIRKEGCRRPAESIARAIKIYAGELGATIPPRQREPARRIERWMRPPEGFLKLNCDASFIPGDQCGGWGFLIRDSDVDVVLNGWVRVNYLLNAFQAETIACLQGVQVASSLGIGHLILETDAPKVKQVWASEVQDMSVTGSLMDELKSFTAANFISFECVYVSRSCNKAAHVLAALGVGSTEGTEHISCNVSDSVNVIVVDDLSTRVQ